MKGSASAASFTFGKNAVKNLEKLADFSAADWKKKYQDAGYSKEEAAKKVIHLMKEREKISIAMSEAALTETEEATEAANHFSPQNGIRI